MPALRPLRLLRLGMALAVGAALGTPLAPRAARADGTVRIGLVLPMTGPFASTGKQVSDGVNLWMAQHGDTVAGKKIDVILKDDGAVPDVTKRLAQDLLANDKVQILAGFGLTPLAFAVAPLATRAHVLELVMAAATSRITNASPYIVRSSFAIPQTVAPLAQWAPQHGIRKVVTLVTDYGPGLDAETWFKKVFEKNGGTVLSQLRVPLHNPDFSPFLQRAADAKPDAIFIFVPSGVGSVLARQFIERGLDKAGIKLIATGDVTDDDILNRMGDAMLGAITAHQYSAAHDSKENKAFVAAFETAHPGTRPNFFGVGGYDGMHLIYDALQKTHGDASGKALVDAMKGDHFESPRGSIMIDPRTRDIVQNIYIRKVEKVDGQLYNVEFETVPMVKDPAKQPN